MSWGVGHFVMVGVTICHGGKDILAGSNFGGIRTICPAFVPFCHSAEEKCARDKITAKAGKTRRRGENEKGRTKSSEPVRGGASPGAESRIVKR